MTQHALDRLWERYGIESGFSDLGEIAKLCESRGVLRRKFRDKNRGLVRYFSVTWRDVLLNVVLVNDVVITFEPPEAHLSGTLSRHLLKTGDKSGKKNKRNRARKSRRRERGKIYD